MGRAYRGLGWSDGGGLGPSHSSRHWSWANVKDEERTRNLNICGGTVDFSELSDIVLGREKETNPLRSARDTLLNSTRSRNTSVVECWRWQKPIV